MSREPTPPGGSHEIVRTSPAQLPPHPLDGEWHLYLEGQIYGPFTGQKLREFAKEGRLLPTTDVARLGSEVWTPASEDAVLGAFFALPPTAQRQAISRSSQVSAGVGATIVQVTNTMAPQRPAVLIDGGIAKPKSAGTALLLSFLFAGFGQFYNGQLAKGILMFIGCIFLWFIFLGWIINLWSMIDAYITARDMNIRYQQRLAAGVII
jgi:TM2 domain-containing membrane protein YozV